MRSRILQSLVFVVLFATIQLAAQKNTGEIRGNVVDSSGAMVSGATVTITQAGTNAQRSTKTNPSGGYVFTDVPLGTYEVKIEQSGFKSSITNNVVVNVATTTQANATLAVGSSTEVVTVEADAIQVQTSTAAVGETVDGTQTRELPLNGRNFVQLTQLQPGVSGANNYNSKSKGLQGGVDFAVNGNPTTNNLFLIDGANNNDIGSNRTILIYPSIDAIQEFKMLRNSYGPEYGQASGSVISIVTRSGQNAFHGGVSYFGRNDKLNATEYFAARHQAAVAATGGTLPNDGKDKLRRNDYAYHIGGPILKDKAFFFWSQEWNKEIRGNTRSACVPTQAEKTGDFSGPLSCGASAPDPLIVPGGIIANPDPTGLLIAQLLPLPNVTPSAATDGKNWFESVASSLDWREENARVDVQLTKKHLLTMRYTQDTWRNPAPNTFGEYWGDDPFPAVEGSWDQPSKSAVAKVTSTLSDHIINDAQFSYSNNRILTTGGGTDPTLVDQINAGIPTMYPSANKLPGGNITFWSGLGPYGDGENLWSIAPFQNAQDLYTIRDDVSIIHGNHTFKVGAYLSFNSKDEGDWGGADRPQFGSASWAVGTSTGNELANILFPGQTFSVTESSENPVDEARWRDYEFYFGDTWKIRRNLTLEYGFRWSFLREPWHAHDRHSSWDPSLYNPALAADDVCNGLIVVPGTDPCGDANAANGSSFSSGTPGVNRALVEDNNHNIAPRFGLTWDPWGTGKTAVRFGIGQFYQRERIGTKLLLAQNAPFAISGTASRTFATAPPIASAATSPRFSRDPRGVTPNSWQWNFTIEQELAKDTSLQIGYVGNRGLHLTSSFDVNAVLPANRTQAAFLTADSTPISINDLRFAPNFGTINRWSRDGWSSYHSLQALLRWRMANWARLQSSYTWAHSIANTGLDVSDGNGNPSNFTDITDPSLDKGNSSINRPHSFVMNAIFNAPGFQGQNGFVRGMFGGWEFATIASASSGNSITVYTDGATDANGGSLASLSGTGFTQNQRPNRVFNVSCEVDGGTIGNQVLNPAAFTLTGFAIGSIGNAPRGTCRAPAYFNTDLAFYKNWSLREKVKLQFRLEFFNAFNNVNFRGDRITNQFLAGGGGVDCGGAPCTDVNNVITSYGVNSNFGRANATRGAREIQYALRITF
jgi:hypothetical protein